MVPDLTGKRVVIAGKSNIVGLPLFLLLSKQQATVTLCHSNTVDINSHLKEADIFISAIGKSKYFHGSCFKQGVIIIDVGINVYHITDENGNEERKVCGDVDFDSAVEVCSRITPVPGGVGPMTVAMLMCNVVTAWER